MLHKWSNVELTASDLDVQAVFIIYLVCELRVTDILSSLHCAQGKCTHKLSWFDL